LLSFRFTNPFKVAFFHQLEKLQRAFIDVADASDPRRLMRNVPAQNLLALEERHLPKIAPVQAKNDVSTPEVLSK
jgi:hypothetical protein